MTGKPHILVVDDDDRLRALIAQYLGEQGFYVTPAAHAAEAQAVLERFRCDAMVLDVMMPGRNGLKFLASLPVSMRPPTLFLSAQGEPEQRIKGLEAGAEDYLAKPFEPKELVLRVHTMLRRRNARGAVRFGDYAFDLASLQLKNGEAMLHLTGQEAQLLKTLALTPGRSVSREALAEALGGDATERSIDVQITRLRKKLETDSAKPVYIRTVRGAGYLLAATQDVP